MRGLKTVCFFLLTSSVFSEVNIIETARAEAASENAATKLIEDLGRRAINTLTNPTESLDTIESQFVKLLDEGFDVPEIAKFVLAKYWKQADESQRSRFIAIFKDRLKKAYASRFRDYRGVEFKIVGSHTGSDNGIFVSSTIQKPGGPVSKVVWKVYGSKIYDVIVEGVSMSSTLRSDYGALIQQKGNVEAFLKDIETR